MFYYDTVISICYNGCIDVHLTRLLNITDWLTYWIATIEVHYRCSVQHQRYTGDNTSLRSYL